MTTATVAGVPARLPNVAGTLRPANRLAEQITGRTYMSHSQLALMRSCPRKFSYSYVQNARPDFTPSSLLFGGSIHAALELFFRARLEGLGITKEAMLSAYHDAWKHDQARYGSDVPVRFNQGQTIDTLHALADRILTTFLESPLSQPKGTILGIEEELRVVLDPDLPDVLAKVDLVTQTEGSLHVIDWKTSRAKWTDQKALESGEQLVIYGVTVAKMSRFLGVPVRLHFGIITKTKTPVIQILPVPTDAGRIRVTTESFAAIWAAIRAGNYYPSPSPQNCSTCPYKSRCPVFSGKPGR